MRLLRGGQDRTYGAAHRAQVDEDGSLRLSLDSGQDRLPWLEGDDEDDDLEVDYDRGRVLAVALVLLLVLAVLVGIAWWLWARSTAPELAPDGSLIEAPAGPYKVRPANPGGREVLGTGDKSFAVGEGRTVELRIGAEPAAPTSAESGEMASFGVGVQLGAYPTREAAQSGWQQLSGRLEVLRGRAHRIIEGKADSGTVFRLQVVTESEATARQLCADLRQQGGDCQVKP